MARWEDKAMRAGVSRRGGALSLSRAAVIAVALAASVMLAGAGAAQDADDGAGEANEAIEITADTLEVRQSENIAIFEGAVNAVQGDLVLNADMLTVYYREAASGAGTLGVSRIDAEGNVVVTSAGEIAQGQRGFYNVEGGIIDLVGGVVLHQGNNIVQGETLTMNLETGVSKVSGAGSDRVQGLFVPEEEGE